MPYRLDVNLRPPEFMDMTFVMIYGGSEEVVVRGASRRALGSFIRANHLSRHPRLRQLTITGPNGVVLQIPRKK
jgi:hypothetical protein